MVRFVLEDLETAHAMGSRTCALPSLALFGPSGIGKSRMLAALAGALGRPSIVQQMSGLSDAIGIRGSHPSFQAAQPSIVVRSMLETGHADPIIILEEIEKIGSSRYNGDALEALLPLLDRKTARRMRDPFIDRDIDTSRVTWWASGNIAQTLPTAIRSRLKVFESNGPKLEHLPLIVEGFRRDLAEELNLDANQLPICGQLLEARLSAQLRRSPDLRVLDRIWREGLRGVSPSSKGQAA